MNTLKQFRARNLFPFLLGLLAVSTDSLAFANRDEIDFRQALPVKKAALPVSLRRNPFQISAERDRPLPMLKDKDDPATKLPGLLGPHIRAVMRQPRPLLLVDTAVIQPGDEIRLAKSEALEKFRIVLRAIEPDRVVFHLTALDPQQGGQVECAVPLTGDMRKDR